MRTTGTQSFPWAEASAEWRFKPALALCLAMPVGLRSRDSCKQLRNSLEERRKSLWKQSLLLKSRYGQLKYCRPKEKGFCSHDKMTIRTFSPPGASVAHVVGKELPDVRLFKYRDIRSVRSLELPSTGTNG